MQSTHNRIRTKLGPRQRWWLLLWLLLPHVATAQMIKTNSLPTYSYQVWRELDPDCKMAFDPKTLNQWGQTMIPPEGKPVRLFTGCFHLRYHIEVQEGGYYTIVTSGFVERIAHLQKDGIEDVETHYENGYVVTHLNLEPGTYTYFVTGHVKSINSLFLLGLTPSSLSVMPSPAFHRTSFLMTAVRGVCLGVLVIMGLFFLFMVRKGSNVYLIYGAFIFSNIFFMEAVRSLVAEMLGFREIGYYVEGWRTIAQNIGSMTQFLIAIFFIHFYDLKRTLPFWYKFVRLVAVLILLQFPIAFLGASLFPIYTTVVIAFGSLILLIICTYFSLKHGGLNHVMLLGYLSMVLSYQVFVLSSFGAIQIDSLWVRDINFLGSAIEVVLFSIATSLKLNKQMTQQEKEKDHVLQQLQKMIYPHQLIQIREGHSLEETMPTGKAEACVLSFDIISSSSIQNVARKEFIENAIERCLSTLTENYDAQSLTSNAYRIKVLGDGFLCSVGYPFRTPGGKNPAQAAVRLAIHMVRLFNEVEAAFGHSEPICCSIGIAHGPIEAYFPKLGAKEYDLYGSAIILATRYEKMRKVLPQLGTTDHIFLQERVYMSLSPDLQEQFSCVALEDHGLNVRDDEGAMMVYVWKGPFAHVKADPPLQTGS